MKEETKVSSFDFDCIGDEMNRKVRGIIMAVLAVMLVVSVGMMAHTYAQSHRQTAATDEAMRLAGLPDFRSLDALFGGDGAGDKPSAAPGLPTANETSAAPQTSVLPSPVSVPSLTPEEREKVYTDALTAINIDALREVNRDVVGWLVIPGTKVSYPMVRGADNDYYLDHNWKRDRNAAGAVFIDSRITDPLGGFNTIIYGHNMNDGQMFAALKSYKSAEFFAEHPKVYLSDGEDVRVYEIFSVREVTLELYDGSPYTTEFDGGADKQALIDDAIKNSVIDCGVTPTVDDRIITLSTCVAEGKGYQTRWIVQAREAVR